jgi:D-alanyl-lipoteichoic acid acyltransferase DltB (MBOAT superfamily)
MLFNSLTYAVFFAIVLALYWMLPWHRARLALLLGASWVFYAAWYPIYLVLFLASTALNYAASLALDAARRERPERLRPLLAGVVAANLAVLGFFKYADFFLDSAASIASLAGIQWQPPLLHLFLPLGISFYTFEMIAYAVDLSRGECKLVRNPFKMALFIGFFPRFVAGPIVRANEFVWQLGSARRFEMRRFLHGVDLIFWGLFKKVVVADQLAPLVDAAFAAPETQSPLMLLLVTYAYSAQIYCDFSGYTDIGRGSAYCLGYHLPRNFEAPYFSVSIADFWRRWHMTLSSWLRDYLYIPLGGNRRGRGRTYLNLTLTMLLGGLWHGANWTFVIWGLLHGLALAGHRYLHERRGVAMDRPLVAGRAWRWLSIALTFHFVSFAWIFFRAPDFATAFAFLDGLTGLARGLGAGPALGRITLGLSAAALALLVALHAASTWARARGVQSRAGWAAARPVVYFLIAVGVSLVADRGAQQFIYFQF